MPRPSPEVEVAYKDEFGLFEETESRRFFACSTTTVLRKAFLIRGDRSPRPAERPYLVLAHVTTEEFPRDEKESRILGDTFFNLFGIGSDPFDLFEVRVDPTFLEDALSRLRYYASQLGADAVIDVYATGEAEHHMWEGGAVSFNTRSTSSPIYVSGRLLDFHLRDVRLHGTAIRYE
jgi:hypothetical protein